MTERAVEETYQRLLDQLTEEMLDVVEEEFGGGLVGRAAKTGARRVTRNLQSEMRTQGRIVVDYAAALADETGDEERYEAEFLDTNPVYTRYDGDDREELRTELRSHFRDVGADLAPLVASPQDDFWEALGEEYSRDEAEDIVERHFDQAETFRTYRDGLFPSRKLADRVIEVLEEGERRLREDVYARLDETYDEGAG